MLQYVSHVVAVILIWHYDTQRLHKQGGTLKELNVESEHYICIQYFCICLFFYYYNFLSSIQSFEVILFLIVIYFYLFGLTFYVKGYLFLQR